MNNKNVIKLWKYRACQMTEIILCNIVNTSLVTRQKIIDLLMHTFLMFGCWPFNSPEIPSLIIPYHLSSDTTSPVSLFIKKEKPFRRIFLTVYT